MHHFKDFHATSESFARAPLPNCHMLVLCTILRRKMFQTQQQWKKHWPVQHSSASTSGEEWPAARAMISDHLRGRWRDEFVDDVTHVTPSKLSWIFLIFLLHRPPWGISNSLQSSSSSAGGKDIAGADSQILRFSAVIESCLGQVDVCKEWSPPCNCIGL